MTAGFCNLINRIIEEAACYSFLLEKLKLIEPVDQLVCIKFTFRDFRF